jgi:hypothetical protein
VAKQVELDFESGGMTIVSEWPRYPDECPTCGEGDESDWPAFGSYLGRLWRGEPVRSAAR